MAKDTQWRSVKIAMAMDTLSLLAGSVMAMDGIIALHVMALAEMNVPGVGVKAVKNVLIAAVPAARRVLHVVDGLVQHHHVHIVLIVDM